MKEYVSYHGKVFVMEGNSFSGRDVHGEEFTIINPVFVVGEKVLFADGKRSDPIRNASIDFYRAASKYTVLTEKIWTHEEDDGVMCSLPYFDVVPLDSDEKPRRIFGPKR